jgi:ABC-type phosphate/phosphonate transport system substrate-binding protein
VDIKCKGNTRICLTIFFLGIINCSLVSAEYVLTAPPRETAVEGSKLYQPIADQLSALLGEPVIYKQPNGWFDYAAKMRSGQYDIVFDGPHFTAWRLKHLNHTPVVVLPGTLDFILISKRENLSINKTSDLIGREICSMLSPFLGADFVYELFSNPVVQPIIHEVKGGMKKVYQAFKRGDCDAAMVRDLLFNRLPAKARDKLRILARTKPVPNQTITVSKRLKKNAKKIANFMISKQGAIAADKLLTHYSRSAKHFERPNRKKYAGVERLLEGQVFGW